MYYQRRRATICFFSTITTISCAVTTYIQAVRFVIFNRGSIFFELLYSTLHAKGLKVLLSVYSILARFYFSLSLARPTYQLYWNIIWTDLRILIITFRNMHVDNLTSAISMTDCRDGRDMHSMITYLSSCCVYV